MSKPISFLHPSFPPTKNLNRYLILFCISLVSIIFLFAFLSVFYTPTPQTHLNKITIVQMPARTPIPTEILHMPSYADADSINALLGYKTSNSLNTELDLLRKQQTQILNLIKARRNQS